MEFIRIYDGIPSGYDSHSHGFSMALIEIDDLPNSKMVDLSMAMLNKQMV